MISGVISIFVQGSLWYAVLESSRYRARSGVDGTYTVTILTSTGAALITFLLAVQKENFCLPLCLHLLFLAFLIKSFNLHFSYV